MRKLAFGAITIGLLALAACGGGNGGGVTIIDGGVVDSAPAACNVIAQTGCAQGQKCAWVFFDNMGTSGGLECVTDGTVALGGACNYDTTNPSNIFDNCQGAAICPNGFCEPVCTTAPDSCDSNSSCGQYQGFFTGQTPALGGCDPKCDPVTQVRLTDNAAGCGATDGSQGCFEGGGRADVFTCAGAEPVGMYTQDVQTAGPDATHGYPNGCSAGYGPMSVDPTGAHLVCNAFCTPVSDNSTLFGANPQLATGGAEPHSCGDRGSVNSDCVFYWPSQETNLMTPTTPNYPDVGWCYTYGLYSDVSCSTVDPTVDNVGGGTNHDQPDGVKDWINFLCASYTDATAFAKANPAGATGTAHALRGVQVNGPRKPHLSMH